MNEPRQIKGRWRLIDTTTDKLARDRDGSLLDKGGFASREEAVRAATRPQSSPRPGMGGGFRGGKP
jgi:hypothetical protein